MRQGIGVQGIVGSRLAGQHVPADGADQSLRLRPGPWPGPWPGPRPGPGPRGQDGPARPASSARPVPGGPGSDSTARAATGNNDPAAMSHLVHADSKTYMIRRSARVHEQYDFVLLITYHAKRDNSGTRPSPGQG